MPNYSQEQLLLLLQQIAHNQDRIITGRGSGSVGQTATFIVDRAIDGRNYVQAVCLSACPPGVAQLFKTDSGQWFALGTQISNAINTKISQNRRHRPDQTAVNPIGVLLLKIELATVGSYRVSDRRIYYLKLDRQPLREIARVEVRGYHGQILTNNSQLLFSFFPVFIPLSNSQFILQEPTFIQVGVGLEAFKNHGFICNSRETISTFTSTNTVDSSAQDFTYMGLEQYQSYLLPTRPASGRMPSVYLNANASYSITTTVIRGRAIEIFPPFQGEYIRSLFSSNPYKIDRQNSNSLGLTTTDLGLLGLEASTQIYNLASSTTPIGTIDQVRLGNIALNPSQAFTLEPYTSTTLTLFAVVQLIALPF